MDTANNNELNDITLLNKLLNTLAKKGWFIEGFTATSLFKQHEKKLGNFYK